MRRKKRKGVKSKTIQESLREGERERERGAEIVGETEKERECT